MSDEFVISATTNLDVDATPPERPESLDEALGQTGDGLLGSIEEHLGTTGAPHTPVPAAPNGPADLDPSASPGGEPPGGDAPAVSALGLTELAPRTAGPGSMRDLRLLADISLQVTVEFGRARLPLRQLLSLTRGAVLELHRTPDQPVDVLVNDTLIARGEVVLVGEEFGVRVTEIVNPNHPNHGAEPAPGAQAGPTDDPGVTEHDANVADETATAAPDAASGGAPPSDDTWDGGAISANTTGTPGQG